MITREQLITAYQLACDAELQAFKPGNVSVFSEGHDMTVAEFRISADVSAGCLVSPDKSLGERIYDAVKATREAVGCNTNLGIILLCAPLLLAAETLQKGQSLRERLTEILAATDKADANWVFRAISLAAPGGLGDSDSEDVAEEATVTLTEAMQIAANKDKIASQYASDFKEIFDFTFLLYNANFAKFGDRNWATLAVYSGALSKFADSHIERKYGTRFSAWVSAEMGRVHQALTEASDPESLMPMLYEIDAAFKAKEINPGTTADISVATVLVVLLEKLIDGDPID
jgi:triphosphoribosyl-dephospho-CoA synthase